MIHRRDEPAQQAIVHAVHHAVQLQRLSALPGRLNGRESADVADLLDDVQLAQAIRAVAWIGNLVESTRMHVPDVFKMMQTACTPPHP